MKLAYEDKVQIYELRRQEEEYLKWGGKRKYSSYQGEVGKKADNLFNVNLKALNKWKRVIRM